MGPLLVVILLAVWTLVLVRILCARATVSDRTLVTYLLLGGLGGVIGVPLIEQFTAPFGEQGPFSTLLSCIARLALLLAPVALCLSSRRLYRVLSVADAFLLAFAVGFGFDLVSGLLAASQASGPIKALTLFPPWQINGDSFVVAGYGYWCGLVALGLLASLRLLRRPRLVVAITALVFLGITFEQVSLAWELPGPLGLLARLTFHGRLTSWLAILAVITLSMLEARWVARAGIASPVKYETLESGQALLAALARRDLPRYARLQSLFALRRQHRILDAELVYSPEARPLQRLQQNLEANLQRQEAEVQALQAGKDPAGADTPDTAHRRFAPGRPLLVQGLTSLVFLLFFLTPALPRLGKLMFAVPLLHYQPPLFSLTLLNAGLALLLLRRYILSASKATPTESPDGVAGYIGEKTILYASLAAVLLVLLYVRLDELYPFPNLVTRYLQMPLPDLTTPQIATLLLLFATLASVMTLARTRQWLAMPVEARRAGVLNKALTFLSLGVVVWVGLALYPPAFAALRHWNSLQFQEGDIKSVPGLAAKLKANQDPVSQFVRSQLTDNVQQQVDRFASPPDPNNTTPPVSGDALRLTLANEFNRLLPMDTLYDEQRFKDVTLPPEVRDLAKQKPEKEALTRLNRRLLEAAYPQEIATRRQWLGANDSYTVALLAALWTGLISAALSAVLARFSQRISQFFLGPQL